MRPESRTLTLLGGPFDGHTVVIPPGLQAVIMSAPDEDAVVNLSPGQTVAPLVHYTYIVDPHRPYARTLDVDPDEYEALRDVLALRDALAKLKPGKPEQ